MQHTNSEAQGAPLGGRWMQLVIGVICMSMIANLQYGWTLFVNPIDEKYHWGRAAIQVAFTIFVVTETWLVPVEGWFVDKFGPRIVVVVGGILCALAWVINSFADSLALLYIGAAVGGVGAGAVYGTCVGNALKWFPDRRGLAAGLTAAGFGAGSALTVVPIANMIQTSGFEQTFLVFGLGQGLIVFALAWFLKEADPALLPVLEKTLYDLVAAADAAGPCRFSIREVSKSKPAVMDEGFQKALDAAAERHAPGKHLRLPSGAGHDAQYLARVMPAVMLFVPSIGGISHHWSENTKDEDIVRGAQVFASAIADVLRG